MGTRSIFAVALVASGSVLGCTSRTTPAMPDAPRLDAGIDAPVLDAPAFDAGTDARPVDAGRDARVDARADARLDAPVPPDVRLPVDALRDVQSRPDVPLDVPRPDAAACVLGQVSCTGGYTAETYVGVCSARELHVLGIYEPSSGRSFVPVSVERTGAALTIVVSSYEAVEWQFTLASGVTVERVVLNGFSPQTVTGLPSSVTVTDRSGTGGAGFLAACAYEWPVGTGGCATEMLIAGVEPLVGLTTTSFTGCYQASSFTIADP